MLFAKWGRLCAAVSIRELKMSCACVQAGRYMKSFNWFMKTTILARDPRLSLWWKCSSQRIAVLNGICNIRRRLFHLSSGNQLIKLLRASQKTTVMTLCWLNCFGLVFSLEVGNPLIWLLLSFRWYWWSICFVCSYETTHIFFSFIELRLRPTHVRKVTLASAFLIQR